MIIEMWCEVEGYEIYLYEPKIGNKSGDYRYCVGLKPAGGKEEILEFASRKEALSEYRKLQLNPGPKSKAKKSKDRSK